MATELAMNEVNACINLGATSGSEKFSAYVKQPIREQSGCHTRRIYLRNIQITNERSRHRINIHQRTYTHTHTYITTYLRSRIKISLNIAVLNRQVEITSYSIFI